jgi:sterol desaturase/sphingolipid hydroxylase (fatty acid hydroxylase superfamily)
VEQLILSAIPFFLASMALEALALRHAAHENRESGAIGYEPRDTRTSITMGLGHLVIGGAWKLVWTALLAAVYVASPLHLPTHAWFTWVALFFADDLAYYCFHRGHHRIRLLWATHVVHHSSQHYNLSTALRQDWSPFTATLFWVPSALFFPPWMIFLAIGWSLLYQFVLHTETVGRLPWPIELIFNTPSHHRVHHGSQEQYLDRNYGGILIVWDRLFGTFEPEGERVRYGLTTNIETFNPVRVAYHEWAAIARDVRRARGWRERLGYAFGGPGWTPGQTARSSAVTTGATRTQATIEPVLQTTTPDAATPAVSAPTVR